MPEVWRDDGRTLVALRLAPDGVYQPIENSLAFPMLQLKDLEQFLHLRPAGSHLGVMQAFREWVRQQFVK